ncbi:hypothetical protein PACTADRAFT_85798 [Pachysolen tannophilus NRRL Y-2460]|uniref:FAD/NAD(P)-binding domain-containing protein n=1 Tax=Pachysolen tannophilus NRRL Y-2460 TaxID=669874 RepID=A0A1E4TS38_PACTA|nr:hypothetical protein PACTADRAFT_85798 [Pachysolen tannophilus NRRL Y-2460]
MALKIPKFKRIAIVGAGPFGLAAARALSEESKFYKFDKITLYEKTSKVGGLWNYNKDEKKGDDVSPMYEFLETNILCEIMRYNNHPFANENEITFPPREHVANYLKSYADKYINTDNITMSFNSKVESVVKKNHLEWEVVSTNLLTGVVSTELFDAVVIANGHFEKPYIPKVNGLDNWDSDCIIHAKNFKNADDYKNKAVLIVGDSSSGVDISTQLITTAKIIYVSYNCSLSEVETTKSNENKFIKRLGKIIKYDYNDGRSIITVDGDNIKDIDNIIFCTGYLYHLPFLNLYNKPDDPYHLLDSNCDRVYNLYKQFIYIPDPTLFLLGLPMNVIPFSFGESQSAIMVRLLSGRLSLPTKKEMYQDLANEEKKHAEMGNIVKIYNCG